MRTRIEPVRGIAGGDIVDYRLVGGEGGVELAIRCGVQIRSYNAIKRFVDEDRSLYELGAAGDEKSMRELVDKLNRSYLRRKLVFKPEKCGYVLRELSSDIRKTPSATRDNLKHIVNSFVALNKAMSQQLQRPTPLPEVSLSKLLHFINPSAFWIVDSRVELVLFLLGYRQSFVGFGDFLKDLFCDQKTFEDLHRYMKKINQGAGESAELRSPPVAMLKLLDKVLWVTQQTRGLKSDA